VGARCRATGRSRRPALTGSSREDRTFADLIGLHREDLKEVRKPIGRSKAASLNLLETGWVGCDFPNSIAHGSSSSEKSVRVKALGRSLSVLISATSKPSCRTLPPFTG
jgi:hypothetical protein